MKSCICFYGNYPNIANTCTNKNQVIRECYGDLRLLRQMTASNQQTALYVIADMLSGDVKIGVSINPEIRCRQIAKFYSVGTVRIVCVCWFESRSDAYMHERSFHRMYRTRQSRERGGREWFSLTSHEVEDFIRAMKEYESRRHAERGRYRNLGKGTKEKFSR